MTVNTTTPKRSQVPVEMTWDLTHIYDSPAEWETEFAEIEEQLPAFEPFKTMLNNPAILLGCLQLQGKTGEILGKLNSWASLSKSEDNANAEAQGRYERISGLYTRYAAATSWIQPEILAIPAADLTQMVADTDGLQLYKYYFETLERERAHTRSGEVEEVLAQLAETRGACQNAYRMFGNADLRFPEVEDGDGQNHELTSGSYITLLQSRDRVLRENAFATMHGTYESWRNTTSATLGGTVKSHVAMARIRNYPTVLQMELDPKAIPTSVYTNLIDTVHERLPVMHRYLRLRKKLLKLDELQMWDLYVPIIANVERKIPYGDAKQLVIESVAPLGDAVAAVIRRGFDERWVDVLENEGKTSGAFSDGSYLTPPYMLMNYKEELGSVFTLAHEWGHSLHSFLARETQPSVYSGYTIFVAEVASTLLEALLSHKMISDARESGDKELQLFLLNQTAERFRTTLFRQTLFAEFELKIHTVVENKEALTAEKMSEIYGEINRAFYQTEVNVDPVADIEWARIPHFYYGYYVYQYATGISAAQTLARQILREGTPAVERYLNFLRGGGSMSSIDLLKGAGVDMTTPEPINAAIDVFEETIAEMEKLAE